MTGNDFENLFRFLRVKLRPAGAQQDSFTPETESEHLAQQGVGMEDHLRITGFAAGPGGNQPGEIMVQGGQSPAGGSDGRRRSAPAAHGK